MTTEIDRKLVIIGIFDKVQTLENKLENMEKKYSREELKEAHFKIGQLQGASLDRMPKVLNTVDPSQPQSYSFLNEDDTGSSSHSMSNSDISHYDDDGCSTNQAEVLEEISKLKTKQAKLSYKLENLTDSVSEKTLILSNIDLKIPANVKASNVSVFPFISNCLRALGLDFLILGYMDIHLYRKGTLKIIYDTPYRLKRAIQQLQWLRKNFKLASHSLPQCHVVSKMIFSQSTPTHYNRDGHTLQKIVIRFKNEGLWTHFDCVLRWIDPYHKVLLLRGWGVRNQTDRKCVYMDINEEQY